MNRFEGGVAVVTGGSSGIGRAVALELARRGANVAIAGRTERRVRDVVATLNAVAPESSHFGVVLDVESENDVSDFVDGVIGRFGKIDFLIAAAGIASARESRKLPYAVAEMPVQIWEEILRTNLTSVFLTLRVALPSLMKRRSGDIVLISSARAGRFGTAYASAYCASKCALNALAWCTAEQVRRFGIRVQVVSPDLTQTPMLLEAGRQRIAGVVISPECVADYVLQLIAAPTVLLNRNCIIAGARNGRELSSRWSSPLSIGSI
jgi:NAD(P)-dependent dehydrogenase (short-subunit alcohol dehydrogenase family)